MSALAAAGFEVGEINDIKDRVRLLRNWLPRLTSDSAIGVEGPEGLFGPPNMALREALVEIDADASNANVDAARRLWLQAMSVVMRDDRRHRPTDAGLAEAVYQEMYGNAGQQAAASVPNEPQPNSAVTAAPVGAAISTTKEPVDFTISGQIAAMVKAKTGLDWKVTKRGEQNVSDSGESYTYLGKLLVKMIAADDIRKLNGRIPMQLRMTLQSLPKAYGKSSAHWALSFEDASKAAEEAGKPIGRDGASINKYLNFLQAFLNFLRGSNFSVPDLTVQIKNAKVREQRKKGHEKRSAFTDEEYRTLFKDEEWCGPNVVHDSTYWVPLLTRYGAGRLEEPCGLMLNQVDFKSPIPSYVILPNEMRTIKSEARRVPIHSELLRLGFQGYCEAIQALGYKELFPDFRARGTKTAIGSLFNKKFTPILDRACRSLAKRRKRSTRRARP